MTPLGVRENVQCRWSLPAWVIQPVLCQWDDQRAQQSHVQEQSNKWLRKWKFSSSTRGHQEMFPFPPSQLLPSLPLYIHRATKSESSLHTPYSRSFSDQKKAHCHPPPKSLLSKLWWFFHPLFLIHLSFHQQVSFPQGCSACAWWDDHGGCRESWWVMLSSSPAPAPPLWCQHTSWLPVCKEWLSSSSLSTPYGCSEDDSLLWGTGKASGRSTGSVSLEMKVWEF